MASRQTPKPRFLPWQRDCTSITIRSPRRAIKREEPPQSTALFPDVGGVLNEGETPPYPSSDEVRRSPSKLRTSESVPRFSTWVAQLLPRTARLRTKMLVPPCTSGCSTQCSARRTRFAHSFVGRSVLSPLLRHRVKPLGSCAALHCPCAERVRDAIATTRRFATSLNVARDAAGVTNFSSPNGARGGSLYGLRTTRTAPQEVNELTRFTALVL